MLCTKCVNRLTQIRLRHYSGGMISDFTQLAQKVTQLAELAAMLRRENAELRQHAAGLGTQNAELQLRMQQAHARVSAVLARLPAEPVDTAEHEASDGHVEHNAEESA